MIEDHDWKAYTLSQIREQVMCSYYSVLQRELCIIDKYIILMSHNINPINKYNTPGE